MPHPFESVKPQAENLINELGLPAPFLDVVEKIYLPLSDILVTSEKKASRPLLVSINGAQGTGKSTLTIFLKLILETMHGISTAAFSLDDFYFSLDERIKLASDVHPLLITRGVPGTHDLDLLERVLEQLLVYQPSVIPRFDKARDDRLEKALWMGQPASRIILFEGWCNHSPVQSSKDLEQPINELEAKEDADGIWRKYANDNLADYHERIFSKADIVIMLESPDFDCIFEWRQLQELKLRQSIGPDKRKVMDDRQLKRFIQHYERITRHTLKHLPHTADIVLPVNKKHGIEEIKVRDE